MHWHRHIDTRGTPYLILQDLAGAGGLRWMGSTHLRMLVPRGKLWWYQGVFSSNKTGGIKNRWNFFLSNKTGGIFLKTGGIVSLIFFTFFRFFIVKHIFFSLIKVKVMCFFFIVHYDTMNNSRKSYHQGVFV